MQPFALDRSWKTGLAIAGGVMALVGAGYAGFRYINRPSFTVAAAQEAHGRLSHRLDVRFGYNDTLSIDVNVSIQKHCAESYVIAPVTAVASPALINANTIALLSRAQFRMAFTEYVNNLGRQIIQNGRTYVPSAHAIMTSSGVSFTSDNNALGAMVHSYPHGGNVRVLNNNTWLAFRNAMASYTNHGNGQEPTQVYNQFNAVIADAGIIAVCGAMGLTPGGILTRLAGIRDTFLYDRENRNWLASFGRGNFNI